jgi:hypothetical protein
MYLDLFVNTEVDSDLKPSNFTKYSYFPLGPAEPSLLE